MFLISEKRFHILVSILSGYADQLTSAPSTSLLHTKTTVTYITAGWAKPIWIHYGFFDAFTIPVSQARATELPSDTNTVFVAANSF